MQCSLFSRQTVTHICRFIKFSGVCSASPVNTCLHHTRTKRPWIQTFSRSHRFSEYNPQRVANNCHPPQYPIKLAPPPPIKTWPNHLKHLLLYTKHRSRQTFKQQKEVLRRNWDDWSVSHTCTAETKASKDTRDLRSVGFLQDTHTGRDEESELLHKLDCHTLRLRDSGPHARCSLCHPRSYEAECVCASCMRWRVNAPPHTHTHLCLLNSWELSSKHTCTLQSQTVAVVLTKPSSGSRFGTTARGAVVCLWLIRLLGCGRQKE